MQESERQQLKTSLSVERKSQNSINDELDAGNFDCIGNTWSTLQKILSDSRHFLLYYEICLANPSNGLPSIAVVASGAVVPAKY